MGYATQRQIEELDVVAGQVGMAGVDEWVKRRYQRAGVAGAADLTSEEIRQLIEELREVVVTRRSEAFVAGLVEPEKPKRAGKKSG